MIFLGADKFDTGNQAFKGGGFAGAGYIAEFERGECEEEA